MRLRIDAPTFGPAGVARRDDGKVVMVHGAYPGDEVRVRVTAEHSGYSEAEVLELLVPSGQRVQAPCGRHPECGGCAWMGLGLAAQRRLKRELVARCVRNLEGADGLLGEVVTGGPDLGYRQRARLAIEVAAGASPGKMRLGFFKHGTHTVVPLDACPVLLPQLNRTLGLLDGWPMAAGMEGSVELSLDADGQVFAAFYLGKPYAGAQALADALVTKGVVAGCVVKAPKSAEGRSGVGVGFLVVAENPEIRVPVTATAFSQANPWVNKQLVEYVVREVVGAKRGTARGTAIEDALGDVAVGEASADVPHVLELYAGHGNFTRPLLQAGCKVTAVELGVDLGLIEPHPQLWFLRSDAEAAMQRLNKKQGFKPDVVMLDPPRTGAKEVMAAIAKMAPRRVVYVSCDPNTFARDAMVLQKAGYRLASLSAFDMMPHTWHAEVVGRFESGSA